MKTEHDKLTGLNDAQELNKNTGKHGNGIGRRGFMSGVGAVATAGALAGVAAADAAQKNENGRQKIIAISCSPRKGMTTEAGLKVCLDAAKKAVPAINTELI